MLTFWHKLFQVIYICSLTQLWDQLFIKKSWQLLVKDSIQQLRFGCSVYSLLLRITRSRLMCTHTHTHTHTHMNTYIPITILCMYLYICMYVYLNRNTNLYYFHFWTNTQYLRVIFNFSPFCICKSLLRQWKMWFPSFSIICLINPLHNVASLSTTQTDSSAHQFCSPSPHWPISSDISIIVSEEEGMGHRKG